MVEGQTYNVYVQKRPGVDQFLKHMSDLYEIVIYTASLSKYAVPLIEKLDPFNFSSHSLFRNNCSLLASSFVKDLSLLGRDLSKTIIIDNSPSAYMLQPDNAIPIQTWMGDTSDRKLAELTPLLEILATINHDIRRYLRRIVRNYEINFDHTLLQLKNEISSRKHVSRNTSEPVAQRERSILNTHPEVVEMLSIKPKPVPIHIRINRGAIEFPRTSTQPYMSSTTKPSTVNSPKYATSASKFLDGLSKDSPNVIAASKNAVAASKNVVAALPPHNQRPAAANAPVTTIVAFVDDKPVTKAKDQMEAFTNKNMSLEYRIVQLPPPNTSPKHIAQKSQAAIISKPQSQLIMMPKEVEGLRKPSLRPITSNFCTIAETSGKCTSALEPTISFTTEFEPSTTKKIKPKYCMAFDEEKIEKPRLATAFTSARQIVHQIKHVGTLIKQGETSKSPIYITSERKNTADIRIRYVVASAYESTHNK